jgi:hypothetical protein
MSPLLSEFLKLLRNWFEVFAQERTAVRAITHAVALCLVLGRRTITRAILLKGKGFGSGWNSEYKLFSRAPWNPSSLFRPVWLEFAQRYPGHPFIPVALDDTGLNKTGKRIPNARWMRDPMSPPFQTNLIWGLRFIQAGLLFPHYQEQHCPARSVPVAFREAPHVKKPGKRASEQDRVAYREAKKRQNLSTEGVKLIRQLREDADRAGMSGRPLVVPVDGSYCNQTLFKTEFDRTELVARCRKDAKLCLPAPPGSGRIYDAETFTPEQLLGDPKIPFRTAFVYLSGKWRHIRYKEIDNVLWRRGAGRRLLRLIVVEAQPYRRTKSSRLERRDPSFLLTTSHEISSEALLQVYCDRWQIEVNHFEEKSVFGVGDAQVRSPLSVPRQPALAVAIYSMLLLAGLRAFGPGRTDAYHVLPKWRRHSKRPSILDLLTLLRMELQQVSLPPESAHETTDARLLIGLKNLITGANAPNLVQHAFT